MKITKLECWKHEMMLSEPYSIAYESFDRCTNLFLRCVTDTGLVGMGCAAPAAEVTGETPDSVHTDYTEVIEPFLRGENPFRYTFLLEEMKKKLPDSPSARAMVDMMLFDLVSQGASVPLYRYLGAYRESIPTSITIGILPLRDTVEKARAFINGGFSILKIKGGKNIEEDIEKILKVREILGHDFQIRFDANQGYSAKEAIRFVDETRSARLELLEQPTQVSNIEAMGKVSKKVHIPVMADESMMTLLDIFNLTRNEQADMINIKLMKVGGIFESLHINSVAKAAGVEAMVGCMDESGLAISAGLHFALSRPNIIYADLDGHLDLMGDPASQAVILNNGILYPRQEPGLGFHF